MTYIPLLCVIQTRSGGYYDVVALAFDTEGHFEYVTSDGSRVDPKHVISATPHKDSDE